VKSSAETAMVMRVSPWCTIWCVRLFSEAPEDGTRAGAAPRRRPSPCRCGGLGRGKAEAERERALRMMLCHCVSHCARLSSARAIQEASRG